MRKLAIAMAVAALAACAQLPENREQPAAASGTTYRDDTARPRWLRDPARGDYPYNSPWF
jgi:hypothetical protein